MEEFLVLSFWNCGVDKRIDIIATAITGGLTIEDLSLTQFCYSPPLVLLEISLILLVLLLEILKKTVAPLLMLKILKDKN